MTIDETHAALGRLLDELPPTFFEGLNGGVCLLDEEKPDPHAQDLYILGEYVVDSLGRSIVLYYGSFVRLFDGCTDAAFCRELRATLRHEFRHHLEGLAGLDALEVQDARQLAEYLRADAAAGDPAKAVREARERGRREGGLFGRRK